MRQLNCFVLTLMLLMLPLFSFSQEKLEGVWGLSFGSSIDSVKKVMAKKTTQSPKVSEKGDVLMYSEIDFGGRTATIAKLLFYKGKFYGAVFKFFPVRDPQILLLYKSVKTDVSNKWGSPDTDVEGYKYPYEKGDGHELTAIKGGYATIGAIWYFPDGDSKSTILLAIDSDVYVELNYRFGPVLDIINKESEEKSNKDF